MPRKKVTRLRKLCTLLAGHSWQQAERIAQAATDAVRHLLDDDQEVVDLLHFQLCLGELIEQRSDRLTAIDDEHASELAIDRELREERDDSAADLRERSIQQRDSMLGLFGPGGTYKIFGESPVIPVDPVPLHQLMGRVLKHLGEETFPMPRPLQQGFTLDREAAIRDLEEPHRRLGAALKALKAAESDSKHSQSRKDEEVEEVEVFTGRVMRFYEALYDLAGFDRLSGRLRRSSHRAAAANDEDDDVGADPEPPAATGAPAEPRERSAAA